MEKTLEQTKDLQEWRNIWNAFEKPDFMGPDP